jgi:small subunit ribosomal protein S2
MVDTNSDPNKVNFAIPANDDSSKSIEYIVTYLAACINEGRKEKATAKEETNAENAVEVTHVEPTNVVPEAEEAAPAVESAPSED